MKLQPASKKEIKRIAGGILICDLIMVAAVFAASLVGIGTFSYRVFVGALGGSLVALLNFTIMCLTIQSATEIDDQKRMKSFIQGSYNGRLILQAAWVVICIKVNAIHMIAGAIPLLFPNALIFYWNSKGKLMPPDPPRDPNRVIPEEEEGEEKNLGPFEI